MRVHSFIHFIKDTLLKCIQQCFLHKIILAGAIPYFLAMFTSDMMEENLKEIEIRGIDGP